MKTLNQIENELEILSSAYDIMSVSEKVQFINALCSFKTMKYCKEIIVFFNTQLIEQNGGNIK